MKNRKNNKGFSLVELIVVVAIMAVLVGVLAPAYLKYVENSREKKDLNNIEEVRHAVEIALADEDVFAQVKDKDTVEMTEAGVVTAKNTVASGKTNELQAELDATVGDFTLVSKKYATTQTVSIAIGTDGSVTVTCTPVEAK